MRTRLLVSLAITLASAPAAARTPNTDRIVRNVTTAIDAVQLNDQYAQSAIPKREHQTAVNLLRDVDYALKRASGDLARVSPEDASDAQVIALRKRADALSAYRDQLAKNLQASEDASKELDAQYRAFRDSAKPFGKALSLFPDSSGSSQRHVGEVSSKELVQALKELAELDKLCQAKYSGLALDENLAFQLAINPISVCKTAASRDTLAAAMVKDIVSSDLSRLLSWIDESRVKLETNGGVLSPPGAVDDLVFRRPKGKTALLAKHKPLFAAIGAEVPSELLSPFDTAVDSLWSEVDRLAPTFTFDTKVFHDPKAEAGAKKALVALAPKAKVQKSAMLFADWDVAKNEYDLPTERYRTGAVMYKDSDSKWCQYRSFTAHSTYMGGGRYASTFKYTFGGIRYQQCK